MLQIESLFGWVSSFCQQELPSARFLGAEHTRTQQLKCESLHILQIPSQLKCSNPFATANC